MKTKENLLRKKLFGISVLFHITLIVVAMTNYFTIYSSKPEIEAPLSFMEINFTNNNTSSGISSTKRNRDNKHVETPTSRSIENNTIKLEPLEEPDNQISNDNKDFEKKSTNTNLESSTSEKDGDGRSGDLLTGKALGELDFNGEGIFGRKVIYRAPIKKLAEQNGRIAVNMGINRAGKVVAIAYNKKYSTITDKKLIVKVLKMATQYRFESDYTAPDIQYGKFTFIFDIN